jgi:hypothetical protein
LRRERSVALVGMTVEVDDQFRRRRSTAREIPVRS